jgi:DnaJ-class molecular chaperone
MTTDHYSVLGVPRGATLDTIKRAHRALARRYHPDFNPQSADIADMCAAVNVAWGVLSDPKSRARLDTLLHVAATGCATCGSEGMVLKQKGFGKKVRITCPQCNGTGAVS